MFRLRTFLTFTFCAALGASASAQSFNLDCGAQQSHPLPASTYGAGAAQPGLWMGVGTTAQAVVALNDINGVATAATIQPIGGFGDFAINNPSWFGDDDLLMEDATDVGGLWQGGPGGLITWTLAGLLPGDYAIYTYCLAPDFPATYRTQVSVPGSAQGAQIVSGAWPGSPHVLGLSYARHTINVAAGQNVTILTADPGTPANNLATVNGFQIVFTPGPIGTPFCFGDGSATACPCGNASAVGANEGCLSSLGTGGKLIATGIASLGNDQVSLQGTRMPNSNALYFQGTSQQGAGAGAAFGDGLRCAGGAIVRLGTKLNSGGASQYPGAGDQSVSVRGGVASPGTRTYQGWYRNAAAFCTAATFNLTNGVELTWAP